MSFLIDILTYKTCIIAVVSVVLAVRYRNYIDWFYLIFLFCMAGGGVSSAKNHFPLGMMICNIFAVISLFCAVRQAKEHIDSKTAS